MDWTGWAGWTSASDSSSGWSWGATDGWTWKLGWTSASDSTSGWSWGATQQDEEETAAAPASPDAIKVNLKSAGKEETRSARASARQKKGKEKTSAARVSPDAFKVKLNSDKQEETPLMDNVKFSTSSDGRKVAVCLYCKKEIIEKDDLQRQMLNHRSTCRKRLEKQPLKNEKSFPSNKMSNDYESLPREAIQKLGAIENESVNVECDWTKGDASYKYKDVMRQFVAEVDCASVRELIDKIRVVATDKWMCLRAQPTELARMASDSSTPKSARTRPKLTNKSILKQGPSQPAQVRAPVRAAS